MEQGGTEADRVVREVFSCFDVSGDVVHRFEGFQFHIQIDIFAWLGEKGL